MCSVTATDIECRSFRPISLRIVCAPLALKVDSWSSVRLDFAAILRPPLIFNALCFHMFYF